MEPQPYLGIIGAIFGIFLGSHMLACVWFAVGSTDETRACIDYNATDKITGQRCINTGEGWYRQVDGWVARKQYSPYTDLSTKYMDSLWSIFTQDFAYTTGENAVGAFAILVVGLIYGSLAGCISSIMMTLGVRRFSHLQLVVGAPYY
eukprot:COSAG01_NODE_2921_length_6846_cov_4.205276_4_plen_148_part_00